MKARKIPGLLKKVVQGVWYRGRGFKNSYVRTAKIDTFNNLDASTLRTFNVFLSVGVYQSGCTTGSEESGLTFEVPGDFAYQLTLYLVDEQTEITFDLSAIGRQMARCTFHCIDKGLCGFCRSGDFSRLKPIEKCQQSLYLYRIPLRDAIIFASLNSFNHE
jgi:hypothetical protein